MADKQVLRKVYLEKRIFLSENEFQRRNELLKNKTVDFINGNQPKAIHCFLPIKKNNEVDTVSIMKAIDSRSTTSFYTSKSLPKGILSHFKLDESTVLKNNKWGIPEPSEVEPIEHPHFDMIVVPLITFDKVGHRIGYGKGYYDRFLAEQPKTLKVGLSMAPPLDYIPYMEATDIKLDWCITPFEVYQF